jgi:hypothetical protein
MIATWLPRGKEEGIAFFGINDSAMLTRQTIQALGVLEVPAQ